MRRKSLSSPRLTTILLGLLAALAFTIAILGLAGVIAYSVGQRTREIGVRMALGAQRRQVIRTMVGEAAVVVVSGLAAGLAGAWFLTRVMSSLLFEVSANDAATYLGVSLALGAVAFAASLVTAHRATLVDPVVALRSE